MEDIEIILSIQGPFTSRTMHLIGIILIHLRASGNDDKKSCHLLRLILKGKYTMYP